MRKHTIITFVLSIITGVGCVQQPHDGPSVHINRTSVDSLFPDRLHEIGVTFVRPYSMSSRVRGNPLIQFNSVSTSSSYIGDTQYMTTISIQKYSETEWKDVMDFGATLMKQITDADWLEFNKWRYSEPPLTTMRESDGFRYYLRVISDPRGGVIKISAEHNCYQREYIQEDDEIIRKIIDSVAIDPKIVKMTEQSPGGDSLKAAPQE